MDETAVLYVCDPEKNTECPKTSCCYLLELAEGGVCSATFHREFAREYPDGTPMIQERLKERMKRKNVSRFDSQFDLHVQPDLPGKGYAAGQ